MFEMYNFNQLIYFNSINEKCFQHRTFLCVLEFCWFFHQVFLKLVQIGSDDFSNNYYNLLDVKGSKHKHDVYKNTGVLEREIEITSL